MLILGQQLLVKARQLFVRQHHRRLLQLAVVAHHEGLTVHLWAPMLFHLVGHQQWIELLLHLRVEAQVLLAEHLESVDGPDLGVKPPLGLPGSGVEVGEMLPEVNQQHSDVVLAVVVSAALKRNFRRDLLQRMA